MGRPRAGINRSYSARHVWPLAFQTKRTGKARKHLQYRIKYTVPKVATTGVTTRKQVHTKRKPFRLSKRQQTGVVDWNLEQIRKASQDVSLLVNIKNSNPNSLAVDRFRYDADGSVYLKSLLACLEHKAQIFGPPGAGVLMHQLALALVAQKMELDEFWFHVRELIGFAPLAAENKAVREALKRPLKLAKAATGTYALQTKTCFTPTLNRGCRLSLLDPGSNEYAEILADVPKHMTNKLLRVIKIDNPRLSMAFEARASLMKQLTDQESKVERVYHGATPERMDSINHNGLRRDFAGTAHGVCYGRGVYYTTDLNTAYPYTKPDLYGLQYVYVADLALGVCTSQTKHAHAMRQGGMELPAEDELLLADTRKLSPTALHHHLHHLRGLLSGMSATVRPQVQVARLLQTLRDSRIFEAVE
eukprot:TRINITY_DN11076_c0_g1_i3.p1 TRINITY_DN11076_c0_g1~~TRINITY_DN11076_c0_g1_i3.p1  ORF type:complete len:418 (+),score=68.90 TRINITY_DN11076_c0_g1_i3:297-1550(+)